METGILRNLGKGKKELILKLHPPDLGLLRISLQVKDKEVSLIIRTENHDVANSLNHHILNFEKSLEQNGLKVVKIEIRNDFISGQENPWSGFGHFQEGSDGKDTHHTKRSHTGVRLLGERDIEEIDPMTIQNKISNNTRLYIIA